MKKTINAIKRNLEKVYELNNKTNTSSDLLLLLSDFLVAVKKRKKFMEQEIDFVEQKLLLIMKETSGKKSRKKMKLLTESLTILLVYKEIEDLNNFGGLILDLDDSKRLKPKDKKIEEKNLDISLVENLESNLKKRVFSQDYAIEELVNGIKINAAGLGEDKKPIGSFLFTGPTGVGKTELAKELAQNLEIDFVRFDMSEYSNESTALKLIGSPAGYVGHDKGGLLTNAILDKPLSVLLLDEIEKAHPNIMPIFLQMMDNAELTDSHGKSVCFKNVIIIMTSNLGTKSENVVGFASKEKNIVNSFDSFFSPEFINRLDSIVEFNALRKDVALSIVDKFLVDVSSTLKKRKIVLEVSNTAKLQLAELGYSKEMGARAIKRTVANFIKKPLSKEIVLGKLKNNTTVEVNILHGQFNFLY